ncbi:hypothetical protein CLERM_011 [Coxiella-like endosymbiont]|nr:hypothetical protein CLERM_694 [Coxiella-like endosymbiont]PMB54799.1 hypothetical protein CLERM_690 [Coxiella-like endosymbiont]PMB54924.1 hypothetical protein CLERM_011 [Coxiella-like endosymbiont]
MVIDNYPDPHNLVEVADTYVDLLDNPEATLKEVIKFI